MDANTPAAPSPDDRPPLLDDGSSLPDEHLSLPDQRPSSPGDKPSPPAGNPVQDNVVPPPTRPTGPNASPIVFGLVALLFGVLIIADETTDWRLDWSWLGPGAIVVIGVVLLVVGAIGLVRRHDEL